MQNTGLMLPSFSPEPGRKLKPAKQNFTSLCFCPYYWSCFKYVVRLETTWLDYGYPSFSESNLWSNTWPISCMDAHIVYKLSMLDACFIRTPLEWLFYLSSPNYILQFFFLQNIGWDDLVLQLSLSKALDKTQYCASVLFPVKLIFGSTQLFPFCIQPP